MGPSCFTTPIYTKKRSGRAFVVPRTYLDGSSEFMHFSATVESHGQHSPHHSRLVEWVHALLCYGGESWPKFCQYFPMGLASQVPLLVELLEFPFGKNIPGWVEWPTPISDQLFLYSYVKSDSILLESHIFHFLSRKDFFFSDFGVLKCRFLH